MKTTVIKKEMLHIVAEEIPNVEVHETVMGTFPNFESARKEVALYLLDELSYYAAINHGMVVVQGLMQWKTSRTNDTSVLKLSAGNIDYTFTAYSQDQEDA